MWRKGVGGSGCRSRRARPPRREWGGERRRRREKEKGEGEGRRRREKEKEKGEGEGRRRRDREKGEGEGSSRRRGAISHVITTKILFLVLPATTLAADSRSAFFLLFLTLRVAVMSTGGGAQRGWKGRADRRRRWRDGGERPRTQSCPASARTPPAAPLTYIRHRSLSKGREGQAEREERALHRGGVARLRSVRGCDRNGMRGRNL